MINIARAAFAFLLMYEFLNMIGVIHGTLVYSWSGLFITAAAVWAIMEVTHRIQPHHPAAWPIALLAVSFDAGGDTLKLYAQTPAFATCLHFTISMFLACILLLWVYNTHKKIAGWDYLHAWTTTVALGAMYDVEEFWESVFLNNNRYLGPAEMTDITADALGALTMILIVWLVMHARERKERHKEIPLDVAIEGGKKGA